MSFPFKNNHFENWSEIQGRKTGIVVEFKQGHEVNEKYNLAYNSAIYHTASQLIIAVSLSPMCYRQMHLSGHRICGCIRDIC